MPDPRDIKVLAISGNHTGQTGLVSIWPIFGRQDWINVQWPDGTITTAHAGEIIAPDEAAQVARRTKVCERIAELSRMRKTALLTIITRLARERGASWLIGGPAYWSKDELITGILAFEFPQATPEVSTA